MLRPLVTFHKEWAVEYKTFIDGEYDRLVTKPSMLKENFSEEDAYAYAAALNQRGLDIARVVCRNVSEWGTPRKKDPESTDGTKGRTMIEDEYHGEANEYTPEELAAMKAKRAHVEEAMATRAEEPTEDRIRRAYLNGFRDGAERGSWGRWDHS